MKKVFLAIFTTVVLNSCSNGGGSDATTTVGACASSIVSGSWLNNNNGDLLNFASNCSYTSSLCASTGTYPNVTASSGFVIVNVTSTNGSGGCLPLGQTSCSYAVSGNTMQYNCGGGVLTFIKQ